MRTGYITKRGNKRKNWQRIEFTVPCVRDKELEFKGWLHPSEELGLAIQQDRSNKVMGICHIPSGMMVMNISLINHAKPFQFNGTVETAKQLCDDIAKAITADMLPESFEAVRDREWNQKPLQKAVRALVF